MYSIQKFVLEKIKEKGITRGTFVKSMGYSNMPKGCRRLDDFINDNRCSPELLIRLKNAINDDAEFDKRMRETEGEIREEIERRKEIERRSFVPFLYAQTERNIPSPIFTCAMIGADRMKFRKLHVDFSKMSPGEQDIIRRARIKETLSMYGGHIPTFGCIVCFTQKMHYDDIEGEREVFDCKGERIPDPENKLRWINEGRATLNIRGRDISMLFRSLWGNK